MKDLFSKTYKKIISENKVGIKTDYTNVDVADEILEKNGFSPLKGRQWDEDYTTNYGKRYSKNILFVINVGYGGYQDTPNGGSRATKLYVNRCSIRYTKVNTGSTLFFSDKCKDINEAVNALNNAIEELKQEFVG